MIRNAVDHGIEDEKDRLAAGKTLEGYILMRARAEGGSFVIEIQDDGKGMNPEKIRQKAVSVGLISADAVLSKSETLDLIFQNGFSTKE
jgi:two-component system chemotaxis sensor kinase CheA